MTTITEAALERLEHSLTVSTGDTCKVFSEDVRVLIQLVRGVMPDAERWRGLMACDRIRIMGRTRDLNHIGVEFWKAHPEKHPSTEFPQDDCRAIFERFALPLPQEETGALNKEKTDGNE